MEAEVIEAKIKKHASIEDVNVHLLDKLDELIDAVNGKDADMVRAITESVAKLNASLKGNDIFTQQETEEERIEREQKEVLQNVMQG
jgi:nitrate reductase NapAB chaperone NapD